MAILVVLDIIKIGKPQETQHEHELEQKELNLLQGYIIAYADGVYF
jgi:hypothetical protein